MTTYNFVDLTGKKIGRLTVIRREKDRIQPSGCKTVMWLCKCDCGKYVVVNRNNLRRKHTISCGCYSLEVLKKRSITHGMTETRLYRTWCGIKRRCYNKNEWCYRWYGKKGIKMCDEWKNDFISFHDWAIKNGYREDLTIDRIDPSKDYCPENCAWITLSENVKKAFKDKKMKGFKA